jgi:hypothetical protein
LWISFPDWLPAGPTGSVARIVYSALHNKSQEYCASHKAEQFQMNTERLRNGSLIFWKLGPPNVIPELVSPSGKQPKAVYEQNLS